MPEREPPLRRINRRRQGDLGEISAIEWFTHRGANVFVPFGHSPDVDLIAKVGARLFRVQVKTSTQTTTAPAGDLRFLITLATSGGNQSWNRKVKRIDPNAMDYLFVLTGRGRRWCIPTAALEAGSTLALGGTKYAEFEVEPGPMISPLVYEDKASLDSATPLGGVSKRSTDGDCKSSGSAFRGSNPLSPTEFVQSKYERRLGKSGRAIINQKRRVTIPSVAAAAAGLEDGDRVSVTADGYGRLILERIELPPAAEAPLMPPGAPGLEEGA